MFKALRIIFLLFILVNVALATLLTKWRTTDWKQPLRVVVYPINADGSEASRRYMADLSDDTFAPIGVFMQLEADRHQLQQAEPIRIRLGPPVADLPPSQPTTPSMLANMAWSLKMRWWAWRHDKVNGGKPDIRLFVLYHDPEQHATLPHSAGLEKGLIGVVNVFADRSMAGSNNMVIAHEMLHTVGATDKYGADGLPSYPDGYAESDRTPRFPQQHAEIMAGRIPLSEQRATIPESLAEVEIGPATAREIRWRE
ncbi:hypothetical protein HNQ59_002981 [Chitinivorax tropicus]|uniref:Uncharacterized protein n=1 Tax=Chitinivorax tropicus TaxID=714531 RepID=A0A840MTQ3_9PROT|nr:hypothetical protein [Chitinivorax tropicus]MBB5019673.1 hypothetical protein [Chitinivorax tropicus]